MKDYQIINTINLFKIYIDLKLAKFINNNDIIIDNNNILNNNYDINDSYPLLRYPLSSFYPSINPSLSINP